MNSKLCKAFTVAKVTLGMFAGQVVDVNDASRDGKCPAAAAMELIFGPIVEAAQEMKSIQREHMGTATNSDRTKQFADLANDMKILVKDNLVQIIPAVHVAGRKIQFEGIDAEWRQKIIPRHRETIETAFLNESHRTLATRIGWLSQCW